MNKILLRKLHRWAGLMLAGFVIFYCLTGLLLNHRQAFDYFQTTHKTVTRVEALDLGALQGFIDTYKKQIDRSDNPKVIRIKEDGVLEFLYGSHGRTTFMIDPVAGTMTKVDKLDKQPWSWLNQLHKAYKTSDYWLFLTDFAGLLVILLTLTGLVIFRYTRLDFLLLSVGVLSLLIGMIAA